LAADEGAILGARARPQGNQCIEIRITVARLKDLSVCVPEHLFRYAKQSIAPGAEDMNVLGMLGG
jgi:hypothetical protein